MDLHNELFDGPPPPQARTAPEWPGYDAPARPARRSLFARMFGGRVRRATAG